MPTSEITTPPLFWVFIAVILFIMAIALVTLSVSLYRYFFTRKHRIRYWLDRIKWQEFKDSLSLVPDKITATRIARTARVKYKGQQRSILLTAWRSAGIMVFCFAYLVIFGFNGTNTNSFGVDTSITGHYSLASKSKQAIWFSTNNRLFETPDGKRQVRADITGDTVVFRDKAGNVVDASQYEYITRDEITRFVHEQTRLENASIDIDWWSSSSMYDLQNMPAGDTPITATGVIDGQTAKILITVNKHGDFEAVLDSASSKGLDPDQVIR